MGSHNKSSKRKPLKVIKSAFEALFSRSKWLNKYSFVLIFFVVWISFIDNHNLIKQRKMANAIEKLETKKLSYETRLGDVIEQQKDLEDNIEKLAKEKYGFAEEKEDVFIIEPKKKKK